MKWIDIKEQEPPEHKFVLCYNKHSGLEVSRSTNVSFKNVTHWMPLPLNPDGSETASAYQEQVKNCSIPAVVGRSEQYCDCQEIIVADYIDNKQCSQCDKPMDSL